MGHWNLRRRTAAATTRAGERVAGIGRRRLLRFAGLLALLGLPAPATALGQQEGLQGADPDKPTVTVTIDYGDGAQKRFTDIAWKKEMTVLDAMKVAEKHPRGIRMTYRGSGSTALLTKIDDLENEGRGRNWIYRVNGELADRSFGIFELKPGDRVLWRFERYRPGG